MKDLTAQTKNRIVIGILIAAMLGVAAIILLTQNSGNAGAAPAPTITATSDADSEGSEVPQLSAGNPGQTNAPTPQPTVLSPEKAPMDGPPKPRETSTEQFKLDAETAGFEFLKVYFNSNGAANEKPESYLDALGPYATTEFINTLREGYGGATPEWSWLGETMHAEGLNVDVTGFCSLAQGQSLVAPFDENDGGNLPCTFRQLTVTSTGEEFDGSDLNLKTDVLGTQSLKMIKQDAAWKVAAMDSYT